MVSDVAVALCRNSSVSKPVRDEMIVTEAVISNGVRQIIETAIKNINKVKHQQLQIQAAVLEEKKQQQLKKIAETANIGEKKWTLEDLLEHLEPIEWEMMDFPNLVLETLEMDQEDLKRVPQTITEIEYYAFREVHAVSFNSNEQLTDADILGKLDNLQAVNMWGCGLTRVPESWAKLKKLSFLGLGNNPCLRDLTPIRQMTTLQYLDLGCCGLKSLPKELYHLTQMVVLTLGGNAGIVIDDSLSRFSKLKRLALNDCELEQVPSSVYTLSTLRHLHLDNNSLVSFTQDVLRLKDLVQLTVTGNPELNFPKLLSRMENIRQIVVDDDFNIARTSFSIRQKFKHSSQVQNAYGSIPLAPV